MICLDKVMVFNYFPANKTLFCRVLDMASEADPGIATLFDLEPRTYERIYLTMTDQELKSVARRRRDPELADWFPLCELIDRYLQNT